MAINQEEAFQLDLDYLMEEGNWFWSNDIIGEQQEHELISQLIETTELVQETVKNSNQDNILENLMNLRNHEGNKIPKFLVLKNLMILLDVSAEILDRTALYAKEKSIQQLTVGNKIYTFAKFGSEFKTQLSNNNIYKLCETDESFFKDVLLLLLYASGSKEFEKFNTFKSFKLGLLAGNPSLLSQFVLERSIENSSQIKQLRAVAYGNGLQREVKRKLAEGLQDLGVLVAPDSRYLGLQQFDIVLYKETEKVKLPTAFDLFGPEKLTKQDQKELAIKRAEVMKAWKWAVIEVSFQETTNSTMERKGKQAENGLYHQISANDDELIYLIDGAGYFRRTKVTETLINNADLVTTLSLEGQERLLSHLKDFFS